MIRDPLHLHDDSLDFTLIHGFPVSFLRTDIMIDYPNFLDFTKTRQDIATDCATFTSSRSFLVLVVHHRRSIRRKGE